MINLLIRHFHLGGNDKTMLPAGCEHNASTWATVLNVHVTIVKALFKESYDKVFLDGFDYRTGSIEKPFVINYLSRPPDLAEIRQLLPKKSGV
jgi:hypothetical protein